MCQYAHKMEHLLGKHKPKKKIRKKNRAQGQLRLVCGGHSSPHYTSPLTSHLCRLLYSTLFCFVHKLELRCAPCQYAHKMVYLVEQKSKEIRKQFRNKKNTSSFVVRSDRIQNFNADPLARKVDQRQTWSGTHLHVKLLT